MSKRMITDAQLKDAVEKTQLYILDNPFSTLKEVLDKFYGLLDRATGEIIPTRFDKKEGR